MKGILPLLIVAAALMAASCGVYRSAELPIQQEANQLSLQETQAELDALACPEGVDAGLWAELKGAMEEALRETGGAGDSPANRQNHGRVARATRIVSTPPTGEANRVNDLAIADNGDGTYTLTWHYRNLGDYGQNGVVAIADLTPLAQHFGETYNAETEPDCIQAVIDGSGNGKVGIEDVTPIAQNFQVEVHHYTVEGIDDYEQPYIEVAQVALPEGTRIARLEMAHGLDVPPYRYWRVAPVDAEGVRGQPSNVVSTQPGEPPQIISVSPTTGDSGTGATFSAEVTGDSPLEYYWNFGGGASPNQSSAPSPTVTLSRGGTLPEPVKAYPAALTVNTPYGAATYPFDLSVSAWWHIEEIPKVPGHEEDEIEQALYDYGPDGSLWGVHRYPGVNKYLIRWLGETFEWEQLPWDHVYDSVAYLRVDREGRPAVLGSEYTGVLQWEPFFAIRTEEGWEQEEIERTGQLLFDSGNRAVMVYGALWVARRTAPGEWEKVQVSEAGEAVSWKCALGADDTVHVLCTGEGENSIIHYWVNGETADHEVVLDDDSGNVFYGVRAVVARNDTRIHALVDESNLELGWGRVILESRGDAGWESHEVMQLDEGLYPGVWGLAFLESGSAAVYLGGFYPPGNLPLLAFSNDSTWQVAPLSEELDLSELEMSPVGQLTLISRNKIAAFW